MPRVEAVKVYCPLCARQGRKKWIDTVSPTARGDIFPYCKIHGNVKVSLDGRTGEKTYINLQVL